jgi:hypothetical protein
MTTVPKHYVIKSYGGMEVTQFAFYRLVKDQESLIIQYYRQVSRLSN